MFRRGLIFSLASLAVGLVVSNCGSDTSSYSVDKPSALVGALATAVDKTGDGLATGRQHQGRPTAADCDEHGSPVSSINQSNGRYPGVFTYCQLSIKSGDTVQGAFDLAKNIGCIVERKGIVFDGVERSVSIEAADATACFPDNNEVGAFTATIKATAPFEGNTAFSKGIVLTATSINLVFKMGVNVSGSKISFISHESWTNEGSTGAGQGTFDTSTGDLWYEGRFDRIACTTSGRCGWNRHPRLKAKLTMSGTTPTGLESLSFGYSNIQAEPGQSSWGGMMVTADGALATGIKARYWNNPGIPAAMSAFQSVGNWTETTNTKCISSTSEDATGCGTGLDKFTTNTKFAMDDNETQTEAWFAARPAAQSFTAVNLDTDVQ